MKKSVTLIVVPFKVEKPKEKMIVQVDNEYANGGYLAEVVEVTPQGMFSKITKDKSSWDIMSSRLEAIKIYLISDDKTKIKDRVVYSFDNSEEYSDLFKGKTFIAEIGTESEDEKDWGVYAEYGQDYVNKNDCKKVIAGPEQIGIIAEYQSIAGANSKREITYKDIQNILDNEGKCSVEWEENQCDGCKANMPVNEHGHHKDHQTLGMGCTKYLYDKPKLLEGKVIIHLSEICH